MKKLKIIWMILIMKLLHHILWIVDSLQPPYQRRGESTMELYDEYEKVKKRLEKEQPL